MIDLIFLSSYQFFIISSFFFLLLYDDNYYNFTFFLRQNINRISSDQRGNASLIGGGSAEDAVPRRQSSLDQPIPYCIPSSCVYYYLPSDVHRSINPTIVV